MLLPPRRVLPERRSPRFFERCRQQPVGAVAPFVRPEVIHLFQVLTIDRSEGDEFHHVDEARRLLLEGLELFGREDRILVLRELVPFDGVLAPDDLAVFRADVLLLEPRSALFMEHVERDAGLGFRG